MLSYSVEIYSEMTAKECVCVCVYSGPQLCPTLCDAMDCSPPGFSVHGIFQVRILEQVAISYSRGSSWPWAVASPALAGRFLATAPPGKPTNNSTFLYHHPVLVDWLCNIQVSGSKFSNTTVLWPVWIFLSIMFSFVYDSLNSTFWVSSMLHVVEAQWFSLLCDISYVNIP